MSTVLLADSDHETRKRTAAALRFGGYSVQTARTLTHAGSLLADEWDKVALLDAGADDYLTKPFGSDELLARLRAVLRRTTASIPDLPIVTAAFTVDVGDRRIRKESGEEIRLTPTEWRLIETLVRRPGRLVSQAELLGGVWGPEALDKTDYLRVYMSSLRRKLEPEPERPRYFVTAPGLGVRFDPTGGLK